MNSASDSPFTFTYVFACTGCGQCCRFPGHVLLTDADIIRLAESLGMTEEQFIAAHTRLASNRRQLSLQDRADGGCELLEGDACRVYPARPDQCRRFPFSTTTSAECPGLQIGVQGKAFSDSQANPGLV